ncbi:MAG TPA: hypothetical protein PLT76_06670 [Candidatus Omnitrophota bacterium]|nr:hypothetical protein [Candidatus Omnitrophota bacterium]HQO58389.1 hypothetical protein [Candidatus Omnitrophota bacterium]
MRVSTYQTIINTIENDPATFEWLNYFIWQPRVKPVWQKKPDLQALTAPLKRTETLEIIHKILILVLLGGYIAHHLPVFLMIILLFGGSLIINQRAKKQIVVKIGAAVLKEEFEEHFFEKKTLYHLTEILSQKYHTLSLPDSIFFTENILRALLIGLFLLFISPFSPNNIFDGLLSFVLLFLAGRWVLTSHHIYRFSRILQAL